MAGDVELLANWRGCEDSESLWVPLVLLQKDVLNWLRSILQTFVGHGNLEKDRWQCMCKDGTVVLFSNRSVGDCCKLRPRSCPGGLRKVSSLEI